MSADRARSVAGALLACTLGALTALGASTAAGARPAALPLQSAVVHDVGSGYSVSYDGTPADARFAGAWVNPTAIASLLTNRAVVAAYERAWQDQDEANVVQILLLRSSSTGASHTLAMAADQTLRSPAVVSSGTLPSLPSARRTTYVTRDGFGQAVVIQTDDYVALLSFISHPSARSTPITAADAERVADAEQTAMARAPGGSVAPAATGGTSVSDLAWAALAVAVIAIGLVTPLVLRRRREQPAAPIERRDGTG